MQLCAFFTYMDGFPQCTAGSGFKNSHPLPVLFYGLPRLWQKIPPIREDRNGPDSLDRGICLVIFTVKSRSCYEHRLSGRNSLKTGPYRRAICSMTAL